MATPTTATEKDSSVDYASCSWTGNVWIKDEWTEEDKSRARNRLIASSSSAPTSSSDVQKQQHDQQQLNDGEQQQQKQAYHEFRRNASTNWNVFYQQNKTNFFKDRHYLHKAFPNEFGWLYPHHTTGVAGDVADNDVATSDYDGEGGDEGGKLNAADGGSSTTADAAKNITSVGCNGVENVRIVEIGCGVGNAILPLLEQHTELMTRYTKIGDSTTNNNDKDSSVNDEVSAQSSNEQQQLPLPPKLHIHCLDFAPTAIQLLQKDPRFESAAQEGRATAHVYDLSSMHPSTIIIDQNNNNQTSHQPKVLANSADVAILLFCLSAIGPHPSPSLERAARHVMDMLKPGGILVLRDYGRLDEAQLKLGSSEKELGHNFYRKGDGTGCYYFELNDLRDLFVNKSEGNNKLELLELDYIQRVYRNRGDGTTRRRVWVQGRFRKPLLVGREEVVNGDTTKSEKNSVNESGTTNDALQQYLDTSVKRWDEYYKSLPQVPATSSLPSNLFQMYPNEFQPWISWQQSSGKRGKRQPQQQPSTPSYQSPGMILEEVTIVDLGCGLGNNTLLDLVEKQQLCQEEEQQQSNEHESTELYSATTSKPPILNVHFVDASSEAIQKICSDRRYQCAGGSLGAANATSTAKITSQVCDITSSIDTAHLDQSANVVLMLFTLSTIGPYQGIHKDYKNPLADAVKHAASMLKPGGVILFRDYGRYDDDQLQLNSVVGAQLCENFYLKVKVQNNDDIDNNEDESNNIVLAKGTGCYFFTLEEVQKLFVNHAGLEVLQLEYTTRVYKKSGKNARDCNKNGGGVVNRTRIWINGRFQKPI